MLTSKRSKAKITSFLLVLAITIGTGNAFSQANSKEASLIPYPQSVVYGKGNFIINGSTAIVSANRLFANEEQQLNDLLKDHLKKRLINKATGSKNVFILKYDPTIQAEEGYKLNVTSENVILAARTPSGMFRAIETIRQLLPADIEVKQYTGPLTLPAVSIVDQPVYAWRGMHLDVSRHFFSIEYLKKFIDRLALYKFNKLHLHLTDDQGWRIEIKKYPKLTEEGAWRTFNNQDSVCMKKAKDNPDFEIDASHIIRKDGKTLYGGFYTQQQMKDVVAYALARHIDIIPEIDMPGHMMAAINSYPFLTCNGENSWGTVFTKPICPCNETTFEFAENVYTEIMAIFPFEYIHIGGDEVDRSDWAKSDACKALMQREGIKDLPALQSYFINRMEKFFNSKGRKLIGWDEILEGGISPTAAVMYWRSWVPKAPVMAAKNGNTVIMTPGNPLYFDAQPDKNSIYNVYHFNPIPKGLTAQEAKVIIGAQANLWTEYIPSEKRADYMYMPRMTALAEDLWTNQYAKYDDYLNRLQHQYHRLDLMKIHYRIPDLPGLVEENVFTDRDTLNVTKPLPGLTIRYTTDGSLPQMNSKELTQPLIINQSELVKVAAFTAEGSRGDIYNLSYKQQTLAPASSVANAQSGLNCKLYKKLFKNTLGMATANVDSTFTTADVTVPASVTAPSFGLQYRGYIDIPYDGVYSFYLTCDDGGTLKIANREVVDNDGQHSAIEKSGQVALKKGLQPFALDFIEAGGGYLLKLKYSKNGAEPQAVPSNWFKH
jgi:hexosaminidase